MEREGIIRISGINWRSCWRAYC